jgi:hypothetical protein
MGKEGAMQLGCYRSNSNLSFFCFFSSAAPFCIQQQPYLPVQWIDGDINAHHRLLCHFIVETGSWDRFLSESLDKVTF